jgi:hypothetical protein
MARTKPDKVRRDDLENFSQKAIQRAVRSRVFQSPSFLYPTAIGALSGLAVGLLGVSAPLIGLTAAGIGLGIGGLAVQFGLRREKIGREYLAHMHEQMNNRRQHLLHDLTSRMQAIHFRQGMTQLQQLQLKFDNFVAILKQALDAEEITYGRYLGIAEQVYLSSLDNLERAVGALSSIKTIDLRHIDNRIGDIHADGVVTPAEETEKDSLNLRRDLHRRQLDKVADLVAQNERAMTRLDYTAAAIADMKTRSGQASMDMETAMKELQGLIERAPNYNRPD